jgi:hypothetical protein
MALREIVCPQCGKTAKKETGAINRAAKQGLPIFCSRECAGLHRRRSVSSAEKKEEKRLYDIAYRARNPEERKAKKAAYYRENHDREKERIERKKRAHLHAEYCRRPEYRDWKSGYDRQYRAKKFYGDFAECHLLVMDIRDECLNRMDDHDIRQSKGTINKKQERRRDYDRTYRQELEDRPLGDA